MISAAQWLTSLSVIAFGALECHGSAIHHHAPFSNTSSSCDISSTGSTYTQTTETSSTKYITSSEDMTTSTSVFTTSSTKPSGSDCSNSTLVRPTTKTTSYSTITSVVVTTSRSTRTTTTSITPTTITTTTIPSTITSIVTYPVTTHTTQTVIDECPTTCSIYAGTVNLFFWPTDNDYIYPSTYVDASLDYTLYVSDHNMAGCNETSADREASTSPSVYMLVDVIYGTNSLGIVGPSATSKIFPLDLDEVSTIVGGTLTEQLSLSDLGTDCPQSEPPSVIATLSDSRCDPILAAPDEVKSWAWPCNACGRFGLFDPPYAIPTLTGGLIGPTTTTTATVATSAATGATPTAVTTTQVIVTSAATATTSAAGATDTTSEVISLGPSGIVIIAYYSGTSFTTTIPTAASTVVYDGQTLTLGGDAATLPTIDASLTASTTSAAATSGSGPSSSTDNDPTTTSTPSAIATAEAPRAMVRSAWLFMSVFILACVLL